ncbi:MAG: Uma2 family endonuclease [Anaerolineae bacterium]|nr:Uma2 family endonuclease [Anaerolineae bacterium]
MTTLVIPTDTIAVKGPPQDRWTLADWEGLPADGNRYEVINGNLHMTTAPSYFHQWIVRRLDQYLGVPAEQQGLAFAAVAPIGLIMPGCDLVQPDFVIVLASHKSIIHDKRIRGIPDLIIEVLSPDNTAYDEDVKLTAYAEAGVPEYGIIDPRARTLRVYPLAVPGRYAEPRVYTEGDSATFTCLPTIPVPVRELFAGAPDTSL